MPRNRSAGRPAPASRAPTRPTASSAPAPQQHRPASTMTAPPPQQHAPAAPQASQGSGLFGQMASTAAGVAVGSSIGHAVGGWFGGGSSDAAAAPQQQPAVQSQSVEHEQWGSNCATATQNFTRCMDEQGGNMQVCNWYLEQLKACQAAARQY